jgi:hypothetical protein
MDSVLDAAEESKAGFIAGFHDPLSPKPETTYWGAFEAVSYTIRDVLTDKSQRENARWMVLVQTPAIK